MHCKKKYPSTKKWKEQLCSYAEKKGISIEKKYCELSDLEKELLWKGDGDLKGIFDFFQMIESKSYKIQYRVMLSRYRGKTTCPKCNGGRLKKESENIKFQNLNIQEFTNMSIVDLKSFMQNVSLKKRQCQSSHNFSIKVQKSLI